MKKLLLLLLMPVLAFGQATTGYHRQNQVTTRSTGSIIAQVVPGATVAVTVTATGAIATIYSDPLLSVQIVSGTVITDANGNYGYYLAPGVCVTENISTPVQGSIVIPNVCSGVSPLNPGTTTFVGPLNAPAVNAVVNPCLQTGATADVQINSAIATLPATGGVVDLSCYGGTSQSLAATVTVPSYVTLKGNSATLFQPASASLVMFSQKINSVIDGVWADLSNLSANSFTGKVFNFTDNYFPYSSYPTRSYPTNTVLQNFRITASAQTTGGVGVYIAGTDDAPPIQVASNITVRHGYIAGLLNEVELYTSNGWINENHFEDVQMEQTAAGCGWLLDSTINGSGLGITGNQFTGNNYEDVNGTSTAYGVCMEGAGPIESNQFYPSNIWDTTTPVYFNDSNAGGNIFYGYFNGTWANGTSGTNNTYCDFATPTCVWGFPFIAPYLNSTNPYVILQSNTNTVLAPNGASGISVQPIAHGGMVYDGDPSGGYAPHDAAAYYVGANGTPAIASNGIMTTTALVSNGTTFTVTGCGTATNIVGGATAGSFKAASATCAPVVTINGATGYTAPNGYSCWMNDQTTTSVKFQETAYTQTTVTFTATGTLGGTDTINFGCIAF